MSTTTNAGRGVAWGERLERLGLPLLSLVVVLLYVPSLAGGYLPYDDDWLIERNLLLEAPFGTALSAIFTDVSRETRLALGAEYLPLRDVSHWCEVALFGKSALVMRLVQLAMYVGALWLLHSAFKRRVPPAVAIVTVACFALHPTHVESVAWLAGRKDVLSLFFVAAALACYTRQGNVRWWAVPLVVAAALSKSMSVICPGLLLAMDGLARRRPAWSVLAAAVVGAAAVFAVQLEVGAAVGMVGGPLGDSRAVAFWSMGEVWLRYAAALVYPPLLSVIYDVTPVVAVTVRSVLGWALVAATLGYSGYRAVRGETYALGVAVWGWLPLLPVSQVLLPLQNVMADRYLWLTSAALGLLLGTAWVGGAPTAGAARAPFPTRSTLLYVDWSTRALVGALLAVFAWGTAVRADSFGDPVALFEDATSKTSGPRAPYQLGYALAARGETEAAIDAYRTALARECSDCRVQRRAANNLASLFVARGQPELAEPVLRRSLWQFPDDPKTSFNLVKVLARVGKHDEARRLFDALKARHPDYRPSADTALSGEGELNAH